MTRLIITKNLHCIGLNRNLVTRRMADKITVSGDKYNIDKLHKYVPRGYKQVHAPEWRGYHQNATGGLILWMPTLLLQSENTNPQHKF